MLHAKLSPSSAHRWTVCTAAPSMEEGIPEPPLPSYTIDGINAHNLAEWILSGNDEEGYEGPEVVDREKLDVYLNFVEGLKAAYDEVYIETKVDLTKWIPEGFGTADCIGVDRTEKVLHVADLKYGMGYVEVEDNPQLKSYGLGALEEFYPDAEIVALTIVLPRVGADGIIAHWEIRADDLRAWGEEELKPRAAEAFAGEDVTLAPGPSVCQWCKAQNVCEARAKEQLTSAKEAFGGGGFNPDEHKLTPEQVAKIVERGKEYRDWFAKIEEGAYEALERGEEIPGFKLVQGKTKRSWGVPEETVFANLAKAKLDPEAYIAPGKLRSVAQVEKRVGKKVFSEEFTELVAVSRQRPVMVPQDDPREGIDRNANASAAFTTQEETDNE